MSRNVCFCRAKNNAQPLVVVGELGGSPALNQATPAPWRFSLGNAETTIDMETLGVYQVGAGKI